MGNPAGVRRKQRLKRRKRYEKRLGPGAYLPKELRKKLQQERQQNPSISDSTPATQ